MKQTSIRLAALPLGFYALFALNACTVEDVFTTTGKTLPLEDKVVLGLKKALEVGIDSSSQFASKLGAYATHKVIKIVLPSEAEKALQIANDAADYVRPFSAELKAIQTAVNLTTGLDKGAYQSNVSAAASLLTHLDALESLGDSIVYAMNRAAEVAAPRSVPIFKSAITSMSITDGLALLNSKDSTAATAYLNGRTFSPLVTAYSPLVDSTLALIPLTRYWSEFRSLYNASLENYAKLLSFQQNWNNHGLVSQVPSLQINRLKPLNAEPIQTESLGEWTTTKALSGLFYLVGEEEKDIRRDPFGYVTSLASDVSDLLREVFGEIMEMSK